MTSGELWDAAYAQDPDRLSWYQTRPETSLRLLRATTGPVVDVGAGTSALVDALLGRGLTDVTLVDVSAMALDATRRRLGPHARTVTFILTDLLTWAPARRYDAWHDRAVLHFLTDPEDRARYFDIAAGALREGGLLVVGGFAAGGPTHCSGLPIARRDPDELAEELAGRFTLEHAETEVHRTPAGVEQRFGWVSMRRTTDA